MPGNHDPRIDQYIEHSPAFAQPILRHLREVIHAACPEVEEGIKWSRPHFGYRGGMLCAISAFKQHCSFSFWRHAELAQHAQEGMGEFGKITALSDLPARKALIAHIRQAMALTDSPARPERSQRGAKPAPVLSTAFAQALAAEPVALAHFEGFSASARREYIDWIDEAKTEATRSKRIATAVAWLSEGKHRHWKYQSR